MDQHKKVRLTIDLDAEQHAMIKMAAAKLGISMRQFVIENLAGVSKEVSYVNDDAFDKAFQKSMRKHAKILKDMTFFGGD